MDDKFMFNLQQQPSADFAAGLQSRLKGINADRISRHARQTRLAIIAALVLVMITAVSWSIPSVRAGIKASFANIAGQVFNITEEYPVSAEVTTVTPEILPVMDALEKFPVAIKLPEWVPQGCQLQDTAELYLGINDFPDLLVLRYDFNESGMPGIHLSVSPEGSFAAEMVGTENIIEVPIGETLVGALIKGGWYENTHQWEDLDQWQLSWVDSGVYYALSGSRANTDLLIEMAASFK